MKRIVNGNGSCGGYVAEDGRFFNFEKHCRLYEKYYKIPLKDLLSPYMFFDKWDAPFDGAARGANKCFIFKKIPNEIVDFLEAISIGSGRPGLYKAYKSESWRLEKEGTLYFWYDISELMAGYSNGQAYWRFMGTRKSIEYKIESLREDLREIENFEKNLKEGT